MEFISFLSKGGPVVYILLALSIYVLSIVLYKLHILYKVNFFKQDVTEDSLKMWLNDNKEDAYGLISKDKVLSINFKSEVHFSIACSEGFFLPF